MEVNKTNSSIWNNYNRPSRKNNKDLSQVTYYNYNKKVYFVNQYTKLYKPKN